MHQHKDPEKPLFSYLTDTLEEIAPLGLEQQAHCYTPQIFLGGLIRMTEGYISNSD